MRTRIISGAVLTAILVGAVAGGRITMFLLSLVITCLGMFELYRVGNSRIYSCRSLLCTFVV